MKRDHTGGINEILKNKGENSQWLEKEWWGRGKKIRHGDRQLKETACRSVRNVWNVKSNT